MGETRPPAPIYNIVAGYLPLTYFTKPPPAEGIRLTIIGSDRIPTVWDLPKPLADKLQAIFKPTAVTVGARAYSHVAETEEEA